MVILFKLLNLTLPETIYAPSEENATLFTSFS